MPLYWAVIVALVALIVGFAIGYHSGRTDERALLEDIEERGKE